MDKVQKHNSFNTKTPSSESYKNYLGIGLLTVRTSNEDNFNDIIKEVARISLARLV
jgi:hypothetical protein